MKTLPLFCFVDKCLYCSNPTECSEGEDRYVECAQPNSVCASFTATTDFPEEGYKAGDVIRRNCFSLEETFTGCGLLEDVEVCFCQGDGCNTVDMPDKMRGGEQEMTIITSRMSTIIQSVFTTYGE